MKTWTQLQAKMNNYREKHAKMITNLGRDQCIKMDTNKIKKIPNRGYFDQWRFSNVYNKEFLTRDHLMEHKQILESFRKQMDQKTRRNK
ncbi:unnamed protein product [Paramecium sonneborni]|uniref:Uncharacterized protein n=1 Tax=Paramecium sonneborni TaxID=65129 RepID=A0A8S1PNZ8_9CILI|nr:unnamed protein product [Paramecium sonneborni]